MTARGPSTAEIMDAPTTGGIGARMLADGAHGDPQSAPTSAQCGLAANVIAGERLAMATSARIKSRRIIGAECNKSRTRSLAP